MIRIIGDTHGNTIEYASLLPDEYGSLQVGDMGIGFKSVYLEPMEARHKWFRGNHDGPEKCRQHPNYAGDFGYDEENQLFWFAGADSVWFDKEWRLEHNRKHPDNPVWWADEELTKEQMTEAIELYEKTKPRIVCSHDGPGSIVEAMFGIEDRSLTRQALNIAYDLHAPEIWVFGHHHARKEMIGVSGTRFVCLGELDYIDIE